MPEAFPRVVDGRRSDYSYSSPYLSGNGVVEPVREGQEVMFNGDNTVGKVIGGKLVMQTQVVGVSSAPSVSDPRVSVLEAKLAKAKADLAAILAGL